MSSAGLKPNTYMVRRLRPEDAAGVAELVRHVYGDSYVIHTELYHPEEIAQLNEQGRLESVVALEPGGSLVGHYALERPDLASAVAESGEAMVLPEHQHHHLLEQMRVVLEVEARRLGLSGIFGRTVTNHVYSQKAVERFGERPCGVSLGRTPRTFHNMREPLAQRMSAVFYFKYLGKSETGPVYVPPRHRDICERIYQQFGSEPELAESRQTNGKSELKVNFHPELQRAVIQVRRVGPETATAVCQARRDLCRSGQVEVVYVELPLRQPGTPAVCEAAEENGFFFSGVAPLYLENGDALRLQYLGVELDVALLQIENPFARELLAYVEQERLRNCQLKLG
jgi:serine/threonine-protein kinase RsbW